VPPLSVAFIKATVRTEGGALPEGTLGIANMASSTHLLVTGGLYLVQPDNQGQITIAVKNCSPVDLNLTKRISSAVLKMFKIVKPKKSTQLIYKLWLSNARLISHTKNSVLKRNN
jgi:hypothetical protein